jgi:hypothetical protein
MLNLCSFEHKQYGSAKYFSCIIYSNSLFIKKRNCVIKIEVKYLSVTPGAVVGLPFFAHDGCRVRGSDVPGRPGDLEAADSAVDVVVRPDGQDVDVDATLAVLAGQAVLVVHATLDVHLFGLQFEIEIQTKYCLIVHLYIEHRIC